MKRDLSRLFDHCLGEINRYTNLLVKVCEPSSDLEKSKARIELDKISERLPAQGKLQVTRLISVATVPLSGKRAEVEENVRKICRKELSLPEKTKAGIEKHLTTVCEPLSDPEKSEIYESFVLKICVTWEIFVKDLLALCLSEDATRYSEYMGAKLPKRPSKEMCAILISGYRYLDFRSISELQRISKNILVDEYNPFPRIPKSNSATIDEFFQIRNYVAHRSQAARRSLLRVYQTVYNIQRFQEPGGFLLSPLHGQTNEIRFGQYIRAFINAAKTMAIHLKVYENKQ
jgi:hypothetical protein